MQISREVSDRLDGPFVEVCLDDGVEEVTVWKTPDAGVDEARRFVFKATERRGCPGPAVALEITRKGLERWKTEGFAGEVIAGLFKRAMKEATAEAHGR